MIPPAQKSVNVEALQIQIDNLAEQMRQDFDEIKDMLRSNEERIRKVEQVEAGCQPILHVRIDQVSKTLDDHNARLTSHSQQIRSQNDQMAPLKTMYKVMVFISSALGISIMALIWSLILGQAQVVFK